MRSNADNAGPTHVKFRHLPKEVRERLLKRQMGEGEGFSIQTGGILVPGLLTAVCVAWFALLFLLSNAFLWGGVQLGVLTVISLFAWFGLIVNLSKLVRWFTSGSKPHLLVTPHYVIDIDHDDVCYWDLGQLYAVNTTHRSQEGSYTFTELTLSLENGSKSVPIKDFSAAENAIDNINHLRKLYVEATERNDVAYLDANDDFREMRDSPGQVSSAPREAGYGRIAAAALSLVLTAGVMFVGISLSDYFEDKKSWNIAVADGTATGYRGYLQKYADGRWTPESKQRLQAVYDAAEQKYRASLNAGHDPKAVEAVAAVLQYARETQGFRVKVLFERHNEISPNLVEDIKKDFEVKNVLPVDDNFSNEKMGRREGHLLSVVTIAFKRVIPDDILEIAGACSGDCVKFVVKYTVRSGETIYYNDRENNVGEDERIYRPGIYIDWDFAVQIPDQTQSYSFLLTSSPADDIEYESDAGAKFKGEPDITELLNAEKGDMYNAMVVSAFDDFQADLIFRMGIGEAKKKPDPPGGQNTGVRIPDNVS